MFDKLKAYIFLAISICLTLLFVANRPIPKFDYDFENFFPQDDPDLNFYNEVVEKEFGSDNDYLLVAVANPKGDLWEPSFLTRAFKIENELQSLIGIDTLISVFDLKIPKITPFGLQSFSVLDWSDPEKLQNSKKNLTRFYGSLLAKDGSSILFLIQNEPSLTKEQGDKLYEEILDIFSQNGIKPFAIAGKIQTQRDFVKLMQDEFKWFLGASLLLMLLVLGLVFKRLWGVVIPVLVLALGLTWAFGIIIYAGKPLDVMSVMQPTIFLIVGLSALIHYFTQLIEMLKKGFIKEVAIRETFRELTLPVFLTIITTAIGFLSLYFTSIPALKEFGLWTGVGILVLFGAILGLTPGLLYLWPLSATSTFSAGIWDKFLPALFLKIIRFRKSIALVFLGFSLLGIFLSTQLKINGYLLDNLPADHPIQNDFKYFDKNYGGSNPLELHISSGHKAGNLLDFEVLKALQKLELKLQSLFGEGEYISPLTLVKTLNQAQNQGNAKAYSLPSRGQYLRIQPYFEKVVADAGLNFLKDDLKSGRISGRTADLGSFEMEKLRSEFSLFLKNEIDPGLLKVEWTGTAFLIDKSHRSVTWQMAKGLGTAFLMIGLIAGFLFRSVRMAFILLIPNIIPLIWMCGMMWILGVEFKLTTAILFSVAFGIAVDDTIHFISKLRMELKAGRSMHYAIKRTFMGAGKAIILTTVILVSGFGLLIFSQFGVTFYTGLLISLSLIFALMADLLLLPILLFPLKSVFVRKVKVPYRPN